jgi:hypothetical protein
LVLPVADFRLPISQRLRNGRLTGNWQN